MNLRFLSVAERELRAGARQKGTFRIRWISAAAAFGLMLWLAWLLDLFQNRSAAATVFRVFASFVFFYCLLAGAAVTADSLSREKREGTLGLLFLTNLNSVEIVAGKLCAHGLALVYSLLAFCPVLALPVLLGGITFGEFWRTVLALVNALFFAMAAGFNASAVNVRQFTALAQAAVLALLFGVGLSGAAEVMGHFGCPPSVVDTVAVFSPLHTLNSAKMAVRVPAGSPYWLSLGVVAGMTLAWLALATWRVKRGWRDPSRNVRIWERFRFGERLRRRGAAARLALRRRLLDINPFFWLAGRQRVSAPAFMLLTIILVCLTVWVTTPFFQKVLFRGMSEAWLLGRLIAWFWTGLAIHALVLYYGAFAASQRLAEDKQVGALELVLVTPTSERAIARGLWLAYWRRMFFPVLAAVLSHAFFIWLLMAMVVIDPPGRLPPNVTPGQVFWAALLGQPLAGRPVDWPICFMVRLVLIVLAALAANWVMLGWVGRWLGLRMKHPGFAPMAAVALAVAPPTLLFSLVCYVLDRLAFFRMPDRHWLAIMMWVGFVIVLANCVFLSTWAATRLRRDFRTTVTGRYDSPAPFDWLRTGGRVLLRAAGATAAFAVALALIALLFYAYQSARGARRWAQFQAELKQRGESLDLPASLFAAVPATDNFAQSPAFQKLRDRGATNDPTAALFVRLLKRTSDDLAPGSRNPALTPWMQQTFTDHKVSLGWFTNRASPPPIMDRKTAAAEVWEALKPLEAGLQAVARAAERPFFQTTTNRDIAVRQVNSTALSAMEQLSFVFQTRACALLAMNRSDEAGEDVLTSLRLAGLVRQSPNWQSSLRVQSMLLRSLQPVWEGLAERRWTESQLAAIQARLAQFDLLSDHTNAIDRTVRANIEVWRAVPDAKGARRKALEENIPRDSYHWRSWQPRTWWYDNCIELYHAGRAAIGRVDVTAGRVTGGDFWGDLHSLPLPSEVIQLFQQYQWWGGSPVLVSFAQTCVNQAIVACALERYRLAHGGYPESLDQLLPTYLNSVPHDLNRGRPLFYLRHDQHRYELRGAGPNEQIEQGKTVSDDWVWSFSSPTNSPPVPAPGRR